MEKSKSFRLAGDSMEYMIYDDEDDNVCIDQYRYLTVEELGDETEYEGDKILMGTISFHKDDLDEILTTLGEFL